MFGEMLLWVSATAYRVRHRQEGQAMVEYALILALVSVAAIVALTAIGTNVTTIFDRVKNALAIP